MPVELHFLGWDRPLSDTVSEWLLRNTTGGTTDLRGMVVGLPTRQSCRWLRQALPLAAHARHHRGVLGPEIVTASVLVALPAVPGRASELQSLATWIEVLRSVSPGTLDAFLGSQRQSSTGWALSVARRLNGLRHELADGALSMADVANHPALPDEAERWQALALLEDRFCHRLTENGWRDPVADQLVHARGGALAPDVAHVVLAGVPDPPLLLITLLTAWAGNGGRVSVLVAAPVCESDAFDGWGRPLIPAWINREIPLAEADVRLAADPEDQAAAIVGFIRSGMDAETVPLPEGLGFPSLAIGVPDRETVAPLQRELAALGLPAFDPQDRPLAETPIFRLVQSLLDWREHAGYDETATVLRHPDVLETFPAPEKVLGELDRLQAARLPVLFADLRQAAASTVQRLALLDALHAMAEWLAALSGPVLSAGLRTVLGAVYTGRTLDAEHPRDRRFRLAAEAVEGALRELADLESAGCSRSDAAMLLSARLQAIRVKSERDNERVDLEGWLELGWNPAPLLMVAGMNEGAVPDSRTGDLFLPDSLRRCLNLRDDRQRLSRDAYLMTALCMQRCGNNTADSRVVFWVGKRSCAGDPLRPSRLLFHCADRDLAHRAHLLFQDPPPARPAAPRIFGFRLNPWSESAVVAFHQRAQISPTALKTYLECPFRFYLKHVLGMKSRDDRAREPDARDFGTLCHAVLETMAADPGRIWACGDAAALAAWLSDRLRRTAQEWFGTRPWLGVSLAVESAVRRLQAFAEKQVAWHREGWEIIEHEDEPNAHELVLEGIRIRGRIDRIDRNVHDGSVCVLDYKTGDTIRDPASAHLASASGDISGLPDAVILPAERAGTSGIGRGRPQDKRWVDLQLPLYRAMVQADKGGDVRIGYVRLPVSIGDTGFCCWDGYNEQLHDQALECARSMLRRIRAGVFWPPIVRSLPVDEFEELMLGDPRKIFVPPLRDVPWKMKTTEDSAGDSAAEERS